METPRFEDPDVRAWVERGEWRSLCDHQIFTIDSPATDEETHEPLLIIHGFPTSSFDYAPTIDGLNLNRRVLLLDLLGFGLSDKPDQQYTLEAQADIVIEFLEAVGVDTFALLTHDMGDTVGGEILARVLDGDFNAQVTKRIVTNGSIYIDMAHLTDGQNLLLSLPDEALPPEISPQIPDLAQSLSNTTSIRSGLDAEKLLGHAELVFHNGGSEILSRTIRYVEQRRANEARYTGAIESHPSRLRIIWGDEDPIAIAEMARQLSDKRPDADLEFLAGVGHYPQLESPIEFGLLVLEFLNRERTWS